MNFDIALILSLSINIEEQTAIQLADEGSVQLHAV
jgi:hypothetical protein